MEVWTRDLEFYKTDALPTELGRIFPVNLLSCVQKALKNIQTKFHWDRMKHKHFIEVSNICPTIT